tara:strand:- start:801 stop:1034 length:234 start_codon:yes stop_codon:yes gene_type:complete
MRAYGHWVLMEHIEETTESGLALSQGAAMRVVSIGESCPEEFKTLIGKKAYYNRGRTALPLNGYVFVEWRDIIYTEE